jgi:flavin reductase (DIM6/NTAB) family NADH-FMN oxidoreductase RutF
MDIDPDSLSPSDRYVLMTSTIQPRPIAWVSTIDTGGIRNLAPFSFFTGITHAPMTLAFCPTRTIDGKQKDTLRNILATKEFVVNIATELNAEKVVQTSFEYAADEDEFEASGLTPEPSSVVSPPRVGESPVAFECRLHSTIQISDGPEGGTLVIGTIVGGRLDDSILKDGRVRHGALKAIGRLEGAWYTRVTETFEIPRPRLRK